MLSLNASTAYKKDLKLCKKRGYDLTLLNAAINKLLIPAPFITTKKQGPFPFRKSCRKKGMSHLTGLAAYLSDKRQRTVSCANRHPCRSVRDVKSPFQIV